MEFGYTKMHQELLIIVDLLFALSQSLAQVMGPFDCEFRSVSICPKVDIKNPFVSNIKFSKTGRKNNSFGFDVYAPHGVNDNITVKIESFMKTPNGFKKMYSMENVLVTFGKILVPQYLNNPRLVKFPLPPGNYSVRNLTVDTTPPPIFNHFFYSTYKVFFQFYRKKEMIGCVLLIVDLSPKKKKP